MAYKPLDDRQVVNRAALPHIGSPANDTLDDIFSRIDNLLAGISGGAGYVAKQVALASGLTSSAVIIPSQPDTSYVVFGIMTNTIDAHPQFQQLEISSKSTTGFTFTWNQPTDSANYSITYVIPFKVLPQAEFPISSGANSLSATLPVSQPYSTYGVIAQLQNTVDVNPQFQSVVIGTNSDTTVNLSWNVATDTANYQDVQVIAASGQVAISNGANSVTVIPPVNFNTASYAVVASIQNVIDPNPQFQPMIVSAQSGNSITFSWNVARDTGNYILNYYAISLTP